MGGYQPSPSVAPSVPDTVNQSVCSLAHLPGNVLHRSILLGACALGIISCIAWVLCTLCARPNFWRIHLPQHACGCKGTNALPYFFGLYVPTARQREGLCVTVNLCNDIPTNAG